MTIQEMFNLLRDYRNTVNVVHDIPLHEMTAPSEDAEKAFLNGYAMEKKVAEYLPRFTPMSCRHCIHYRNCNRSRPFNVCDEYDVED